MTWPRRTRSTRFETLPPMTRPSATGQHRWRAPERAKKTSIQATASAVSTITTAVALANSPNAMPEFCTWWIESGPTTSPPRRARAATRRCASSAGPRRPRRPRRRRAPSHCAGPAASERSAVENGASPSVAEPTRTSARRARRRSRHRRSASRWQSMQSSPTAAPRAAPRRSAAAVRALAVRAVLDARERASIAASTCSEFSSSV